MKPNPDPWQFRAIVYAAIGSILPTWWVFKDDYIKKDKEPER